MAADWNDIRFFLAVARARTLARAATTLRVDQTTVGRRLASLEKKLRVALFVRAPGGLELTAAGTRILATAERMEEAALELSSQAVAEEAPCAGTVRIATTEWLAERFVIPALGAVHARYPELSTVIHTSWNLVDLRKGDADLAVRLVRPTDPRLACRKLAELALRWYASRAYVARHGTPRSLDGHRLLAYEDEVRLARHGSSALSNAHGEVALQTNSGRVLVAAALAGTGIAHLPCYLGDAIADLVPVLPGADRPYTVWLVVPAAKRHIASIRAVAEAIAAGFAPDAARPSRHDAA